MGEYAKRAFELRQRAEELRMIEPGLRDKWTRETFLRLADNYDDLADIHERIATLKL
jgi:hypothetical protein